ncbi:MAG: hypothetical protein SGILL_002811 [Bacillariaceae sp.]
MNRYVVGERLGTGTFGDVFTAVKKSTNKKCLKKIFPDWDTATKEGEFQAIWSILHNIDALTGQHLVRVYDICLGKDKKLYFVMEYMKDGTLYEYLEKQKMMAGYLTPQKIQSVLRQCLKGLRFIHHKGFIHRDVKPENIMMKGVVVKIGDLSLTRPVHGRERRGNGVDDNAPGTMTTYVATRWYRAPELLRPDLIYSCSVDMFALGCVAAELHSLVPLFQGRDNGHQLQLITQLLSRGSLSFDEEQVVEWTHSAEQVVEKRLAKCFPKAKTAAIDLMANLLEIDPRERYSAVQALRHRYFHPRVTPKAPPPPTTKLSASISSAFTPYRSGPGQRQFVTESKSEQMRRRYEQEQQYLAEQEQNDLVRAFLYPNTARKRKRDEYKNYRF